MPSLFHRRSRSLSTARPQQPTSNSAHMAATQAFLANRVSQGNLSASAAAAALRAMSPPPTPVADVQTKRMQRRSSSASSANTSTRGRPRGGLDRKSSSGSMTERTFRSPSPGRPVTPTGPGIAPPVPKLPEDIPPVPQLQERPSKRSVSLDNYGTRQAPQPAAPPSTAPDPQSIPKAAAAVSVGLKPNGTATNSIQRTDSRNSINYSRPLSPPPQSPSSPAGGQKTMKNGISPAEAENVQHNVSAVAQQPVKKKKKKSAPRGSEGSHLQTGSMGSKPVTTPLAPGPEVPPNMPQPEAKKKKKKVALTGQSTHFPQASEPVSSDQDSDSSPDQQRRSHRASGMLMKQPSVVREDWEGEQEYETPEAQRREEQGLSPMASPAAAIQSKKSTAANMSRKIEEPPTTPPIKHATPVAQSEAYHAVTQSPVESDTRHLTVQQPQPVRQSSLSPSRSTRFSEEPSDLAAGKKHDPLPRSVSPVKSALKHHSPVPGEDRLSKPRGSSTTPSDASDSNMSADGSVRRKKSVRVSFEPEPEVVGIAAEPQETDSPVIQSPQVTQPVKKGGFFSLGRSKPPLTTIPSDDNLDEHMKPRPQLPSFGSIRNKARRVDSSDSVEVAPTADKLLPSASQVSATSSDVSSSPDISPQDHGVSSDHAIGTILSQDARGKATSHDPLLPLPPVVTSVEGGGYMSDTESDITVEETDQTKPIAGISNTEVPAPEDKAPTATTAQPHLSVAPSTSHEASVIKDVAAQKSAVTRPADSMPSLSLQPPTPGDEEGKPSDQWLVEVPGGFPSAAEDENQDSNVPTQTSTTDISKGESKAFGPSEAEMRRVQEAQANDESASDGDSIYSDAEEDLSDREGFGSIDAIVDSPMTEYPKHSYITTPPQSPLAEKHEQRAKDTEHAASWDETEQRWKDIAQQSRETKTMTPEKASPEPPRQPGDQAPQQASQQLQAVTAAAKPKKKKKSTAAAGAAAVGAAVAATPASLRQSAPPKTPPTAMRSSLRQQPVPQAASGPGAMRTSMRQQANAPNPRGLQASRWATAEAAKPSSPPQPVAAPPSPGRAALQKKHLPSAAAAPTAKSGYKPPPPPLANDSDSDSSFKKERRSKKPADGSYSMRRSMRSSEAPPPQSAGRGAVRSLSPPARRPFSPGGDHTMRSSMRGTMNAAPAPTLRGPPKEQKRSSSLFGKRKAKSPTQAGFGSRLGDSDDEDDRRPTTFRSRFADSSDDEAEPPALRPVRGIPKRRDDGDSTDLDDSSDEEKKKPNKQLKPAIKIDTNSAQKAGSSLDVPLSPNTMKKKGLFSRFRSKKNKGDVPPSQNGAALASPTSSRPGTQDEDTPFDSNMGFGSSAERDAMIQQTMAKLEAAKKDEPGSLSPVIASPAESPKVAVAGPQSPTGGKLQRRRPERVMSDSWPLVDTNEPNLEDRPSTAGAGPGASNKYKSNGMGTLRPSMHERKATNESLHTDGGSPGFSSKGKKKRFPMLRKAFGLKD